MYVNETPAASNPLLLGNGIHFQNPGHSNGTMSVRNDGSSGQRGFDNQAFVRESYNHVNDGSETSSSRGQRLDYSPLSPDPPVVGGKRIKRTSESQEFRPDLPPRDHPPSRIKYNSNSSLDSGGTTTPTVPKMGITRSMQANGQVPGESGTPSPTGPKSARLLPTIDPITHTPVSPLASPTHSSSSSSQKMGPSPRVILRNLPLADKNMHSPSGGYQMTSAHLSHNLNSPHGSVSPEDISAEFPPPPDFTQPIPTSVPQTAKIKSRISASRSAEEAARISRV